MSIMTERPATSHEAVAKLTPMVRKLAHRYARNHRSNDFDDLVQTGYIGLLKAFEKYDPSLGMAFSSYAYSWVSALMNDDRRKTYKTMNNTSSKTVEDAAEQHSYRQDIDNIIDFNKRLERLSTLDRAIVRARAEGYNYRQMSEALTKLGNPITLHQVRNRFLAAMDG